MSELYHVTVQRKGIATQMQMNYTSKEAAMDAFDALDLLGREGTRRLVLEDSFGVRISFDPDDIGHVSFLDASRVLEMRAISTLMEMGAQAEVQKRQAFAQRNGILVPAGPGDIRQ